MSFVYPNLLWALLAVLLPIIIHLFNFRIYKTVYFSNTAFLTNVRNISKSKSKLKNLLILLFRILAISALVLAFARPFVPNKNSIKTNNQIVSIYLDNSFSMNASGEYGNLFSAAQERARMLVSLFDNNQQFIFLTNDLKTEHSRPCNKQQIAKYIAECQLTHQRKIISELSEYNKNVVNQYSDKQELSDRFYIISDFQKNITDFDKIQPDSSFRIFCLPIATNKINNIYIDSAWFASPARYRNKHENLQVKIVNNGDENYSEILLNLNVDGKQKMLQSFDIEANSSKILSLNFTNTEIGILPSYLEITDYPITFDNKLYFSYNINPKTEILIINQKLPNKYLNSLFRSDSNFVVTNSVAERVKSSQFANYQLIILNALTQFPTGLLNELSRFVAQGGTLLCLPPDDMNISEFNKITQNFGLGQFLKTKTQGTKIGKINYDHFIYKNVFAKRQKKLQLPKLKHYYKLKLNYNNLINSLLEDISGNKLLVQSQYKRGKVYLFAFSLDTENSNFVEHPLFVPSIYNIAAFSQSDNNLYYTLSKNQIVELDLKSGSSGDTYKIVNKQNNVEFIPQIIGKGELGTRINLMNNINKAGNYFATNSRDTITSISFNYNHKESDIQYFSNDEIRDKIEKYKLSNVALFSGNINELKVKINDTIKERSEAWLWFIILAILFLIGEIIVVKFM